MRAKNKDNSDVKKLLVSAVLIAAFFAVSLLSNASGISGFFLGVEEGGVKTAADSLSVSFADPTPADGTLQASNSTYVSVTSSAAGTHYSFVDFDRDLAMWMRMDDANQTGANAAVYDLSTYGNDGTANGDAVQTAAGRFGKGFVFDGDGDYIEVTPQQTVQGQFTVSAWVKTSVVDDGMEHTIIGTRGPNGDSSFDFKLSQCCANEECADVVPCIHSDIGDGTDWLTTNADAGFNHTADTWYHVVYVVNQTGYAIYADGNEIAYDYSAYDSSPLLFDNDGTHNLFIGQVGYGDEFFNGTIDDVLIFNRSLSSEEIKSLYDAAANQYSHDFTGLALGVHTIQGYAVDAWGNEESTETLSITIKSDITPPAVAILNPENRTYGTTNNIPLNYTATDGTAVDTCWYSLDGGADTALADCGNSTFNAVSDGGHNVRVYANDTDSNIGSAVKYFSVDTVQPSVGFVPPTPGDGSTTKNNWAYLNATITDGSGTSAFFDWNNSLAGYWAVDSYNSTGIYDNSSYGRFGTFNGGMGTGNIVTGKFGKALQFDGVNDYVSVPNMRWNSSVTGITLSALVKITGNPKTDPWYDDAAVIISMGDPADYQEWLPTWHLWSRHVSAHTFAFGSGEDSKAAAAFTPNLNEWYHVVGTYDPSTGNISLYVDGSLEQSVSYTPAGDEMQSNSPIWIGRGGYDDSEPSRFLNGSIDEVQIFKRALSPEEVGALYDSNANRLYHNFTGLSNGTYAYRGYATDAAGNSARTSESTINATIVPKEAAGLALYFNGGNSTSFEAGTSLNITAELNLSGKTIYLFTNFTGYTQSGTTPLTDVSAYGTAGTYNITAWFPGDIDYDAVTQTNYLTITAAPSPPSPPPSGGGGGGGAVPPTSNATAQKKPELTVTPVTDSGVGTKLTENATPGQQSGSGGTAAAVMPLSSSGLLGGFSPVLLVLLAIAAGAAIAMFFYNKRRQKKNSRKKHKFE